MGSEPYTEVNFSTVSVYASLLKEIREKFEQYPAFRELWVLDIANDFVQEYQEDEFVKVYANNDKEIRDMALKAANKFVDKITNAKLDPFIKDPNRKILKK